MKRYLLLVAFIPFYALTFAQQPVQQLEIRKLEPSREVAGGSTTIQAGQKPAEPDSVVLARLDYQIMAIRSKMEYVRSNPAMMERATRDGWFEQMEKHIAGAESKKKQITGK